MSEPTVSSVSSISDIDSSGDSSDADDLLAIAAARLPRVFRDRSNPFDELSDEHFRERFRMNKQSAVLVLDQIQENIQPFTNRNFPISAMNQLLLALRFYATGTFQQVIGDNFSVTKATAGRIIHRVTHHLALLRPRYIKMPATAEERQNVCLNFFGTSGFPNVCGAIDCTHIRIQSPGGEEAELFRNRKGFFSINVQAVCDAKLRIMEITARWPGSTHDSRIFDNSLLRAQCENGEFENCYLLGDSGYPCRNYILTPILRPLTAAERRYNSAHIRTRNTVERTFGVLKRRFACLSMGLHISLDRALAVIVAVSVLHNICLTANDNMYEDDVFQANEVVELNLAHGNNENYATRNAIVNEIFTR